MTQPAALPIRRNHVLRKGIVLNLVGRLQSSPGFLALTVLAALLVTVPAEAHADPDLAGGFVTGFLHPLSGYDHMLAMVSVGLWGAFLGRPLIVVLPMIFPAMMAVGGALGMIGVLVPPVEIGIAVSVVVLGAAVAFKWRPPVWLAVVMVAIFALFHGYAHGHELPSIADPIAYSLGFVIATGALHIGGIAFGMFGRWASGAAAIRVAGATIAVLGGWFLYAATT